jgi:hypothetical protein
MSHSERLRGLIGSEFSKECEKPITVERVETDALYKLRPKFELACLLTNTYLPKLKVSSYMLYSVYLLAEKIIPTFFLNEYLRDSRSRWFRRIPFTGLFLNSRTIANIYKYIVTCNSDYTRILNWMIGFVDTLYTVLRTTVNTALSLIYTLYNPPLHTDWSSQSSLVISWQQIYEATLSFQITREVFFLQPNSFLAIILQLPTPKTQLDSIPLHPSSYPGRLASRNSTNSSQLKSSL